MELHDAIDRACADVGIRVPADRREGRWIQTDTLDGKRGKGDGRLIINAQGVTAWNWRTGEKASVRISEDAVPIDRRKFAQRMERDRQQKREKADRSARLAATLLAASALSAHPYMARKGFAEERVHVIGAEAVSEIGGSYLVPEGGKRAIVVPARASDRLSSAQLIWEDGTKKFLAGGEMGGAAFHLTSGREVWLDTDPDCVLSAAVGKVEGVVICGLGKDGELYFASSFADGGDSLWWMRRAEHALMKITDDMEAGER